MSDFKQNNYQPPGWGDCFLAWFCDPKLLPEIQGDLHELFRRWVQAYGLRKARWLYAWHVLTFFRPFAIRRKKSTYTINRTIMFRNYLTIAFRNLSKHKSFAAINIAGLTLGITGALIIFLLVRFELSFDTFHSKADRIYRVLSGKPGEVIDTGTPNGLMRVLENEFPEIEQVAVAYKLNSAGTQIKVNEQVTREPDIYFITPSFFEMFNFQWKVGSPEKSLSQPGQVVIDEDLAQKYFQGDAIGKPIKLNNQYDLVVSGIIQNSPKNTDFPIQMAISHVTFQRSDEYQDTYNTNSRSSYQTYILLKKRASPQALEAKFYGMMEKYVGKETADKYWAHALQPLKDIHFNKAVGGNGNNFSKRAISKETLGSLSLIGIFLLLTACTNFVNLATAQGVTRSKEVGIRKVLGSSRSQLIGQFMSETFLLTFVALLLSFLLAYYALSYLPNLFSLPSSSTLLYQPQVFLFSFVICLIVSILAGFYPALILSKFQPTLTIKNSFTNRQTGGLLLRKGLITFQFTLSQALIICTIVVVSQMRYFNSTTLGFDKEAIVTVDLPEHDPQKLEAIRNALSQSTAIKNITFSLNTPASTNNQWWNGFTHRSAPEDWKQVENKFIDEYFLDTYNIPLLAGRNLKSSDSIQILVNESLILEIGLKQPQKAIGETIHYRGREVAIVGVVKDFHSVSLHENIPPLILSKDPTLIQKASFKINMGQAQDAIAQIEQQWKAAFPDYYFAYQFLDDDLATFYEQEQKTSRLLSLFAGLAIFIGCLGLYGLISFMTVQKTKEVGIRKVLGATVQHIVYLFTKDFVALIALAFAIAAPIGYYLMRQWLADFTYKITISWWMFALAALAGVIITGLTISFKSVKAALANPVDSLRNE